MWHVACGMWHVACGMWHVACGVWRVACGVWCCLLFVVCSTVKERKSCRGFTHERLATLLHNGTSIEATLCAAMEAAMEAALGAFIEAEVSFFLGSWIRKKTHRDLLCTLLFNELLFNEYDCSVAG